MTEQYTETENGALAYKSSGNLIVDYFMMFVRDMKKEENYKYIEKCWNIDPVKTVAVIFNGRDRKNGKKEKKIANDAMCWLKKNKPMTYNDNILTYINEYGRWKDALNISFYDNTKDTPIELKLFADQLMKDKNILSQTDNKSSISLCAKWAPSENDRNDKKKMHAKILAKHMFGEDEPKKMEKYRKEIIAPLRNHLKLIENKMCNNEWNTIDYKTVPAVASKRFMNAFRKHDNDRYQAYLDSVKRGEVKMKTTGILPHELANYYITNSNDGINDTIELQWKAIENDVKESGKLMNAISIVDVSGSMFSASNGSIPAQVAIALGIITSRCCNNEFKNKIITFSENPELMTIPDTSLFDAYQAIRDMEYGYSTDFLKCCESIINYGKLHNIKDEDMPKKLFVFTDMQFDSASKCEKDMKTIHQTIKNKFRQNEYTMPKFIYWNLNSNHEESFPVNCSIENTAMISGFSEQLLKVFMTHDDFNPDIIVDEILKPYIEKIKINQDEI